MNNTVKSIFVLCSTALLLSSCSTMNTQGTADDDLYFSKSVTNTNNGYKKIPTVDIEKIKRDYPSRVDTTKPGSYHVDDEFTANPRAVLGYPAYKATQDSIYKLHPEYSGYYQPFPMPPFSLRDEYLRQKAERRQQRRLARINNRRYYRNNGFYNSGVNFGYGGYGYNNFYNPWYGNMGFGYNNWGPSINFGWNNFGGWNTGIGFGYNPWGFNNFYSPFSPYYGYNYYNYNPFYPSIPYSTDRQNAINYQSKSRQVIGSNLPATNGGTLDNPNPLRTAPARNETPNQVNPNDPNQGRMLGSGGTLINTPNGVQYIAPRSNETAPPSYSTFEKSREVNQNEIEFRKANPQYQQPTPVEAPKENSPVYTQPRFNNEPRNNQYNTPPPAQNYSNPVFNQPNFNNSRPSGTFQGGSMNNGGGGSGRGNGGGGSMPAPTSRPR